MRLEVAGNGPGGPESRRRLGQRVRLAVGRFGPRIEKVRLRLLAMDGAGAGGCRLEVRLRSGEPLVFEDIGADPVTATARVADRAAKALDRLARRESGLGGRAGF